MTDSIKVKAEDIMLNDHERSVLNMLPRFQSLDKGSQNRLRAKVDALRKTSPNFARAFEISLGSIAGAPQARQEESIFGTLKDVLLHPITAVQGKIGASLLKRRNKAPKILQHPDPVLAKVAEPWDFEKDSHEELIAIVRKLGAALRGVNYGDRLGMAAPQIGISKRVMVCQGAVCVNPTWQPPSHPVTEDGIEGCYSVPGKLYSTKRDKYGWATWYSVDGEKREFKLKGKDALVFQHELDHLDGKCCVDIGVEYTPKEHVEALAKEGK